jgi:asparagine synthase (glutamine-hydrolysing)
MCGLAGVFGYSGSHERLQLISQKLAVLLRHRGPDGTGVTFPCSNSTLVHTRLAILDLSPAGHQPMSVCEGRYSIVFNGEIYNFRELRRELESKGVVFKTGTDTELVLQSYVMFSKDCVRRFEGMFAFAVWDNHERTLFLARDPLGIKPMYVWQVGTAIAFASELVPLLETKLGDLHVDPNAVVDFLRFGSVQEPSTLISGVAILGAGHTLTWVDGVSAEECFWRLSYHPEDMTRIECIRLTREALTESLNRHFVSDVPVGVFLSGGLDSSALVALAHSIGYRKLRTFCISFEDRKFNEGDFAARTARHFGTDHVDWRMTPTQGRILVHEYLDAMDLPSNDGFNTFCVSKLASERGLKVVLSGLGGDELFAGYPSFKSIPKLLASHQLSRLVPGGPEAFKWMASCFGDVRKNRLREFFGSQGSVIDAWSAVRGFYTTQESVKILQEWIGLDFAPESYFTRNAIVVNEHGTIAEQISECETRLYMRNQLLRDSDVMSMRCGLELRVPFVDRKLVDTVSKVPSDLRFQSRKKLIADSVPEIPSWVLSKRKQGFCFPFEQWVANEWKPTFEMVTKSSPVAPISWYRTWILFVLQHFLKSKVGYVV